MHSEIHKFCNMHERTEDGICICAGIQFNSAITHVQMSHTHLKEFCFIQIVNEIVHFGKHLKCSYTKNKRTLR